MSMSTSTSTPTPTPLACPEIDRSELEAVRRFLTAQRDDDRRARPIDLPGGPQGPSLRHGIARARNRNRAARAAG